MSGSQQPLVGYGAAAYKISNSLRFRSSASAYLSRTPTVAGNRKTWTWSGWVKRGLLGSAQYLLIGKTADNAINGTVVTSVAFTSSDTIEIYSYTYGTGVTMDLITTQVFRDPSSWYHIEIAIDTTQATSSNRAKLYVNGSQVTAFGTATYPSQNADLGVNYNFAQRIGIYVDSAGAGSSYFDGYMADINFIDGQALDPTSFGAFDATTGVWTPKSYAGAYGTNGFHLNFSNGTSTTTLGYDSSGNSNNWTTNNISLTAGSTYDWMLDSPTPYQGTSYGVGNYAVLNPLQTGSYVTGSNANLTITGNTATNSALALSSIANLTSGKWYWEYTQGTVGSETCGAMLQAMNGISLLDGEATTNSYGIGARASGSVYGASKTTTTITSWTTGDVIGIAVDIDNGAIYWSKNGTWLNSGVPTSGASKTGAVGAWTPSSSIVVTPSFGAYNGGSISATLGQRPFAYTPPSGYKSLCTYNLPTPTIQNGAGYMAATLWTGDGNYPRTITNTVNSVSLQPDFVWIKSRSNAYDHVLWDVIRGTGNLTSLNSNTTAAEGAYYGNANLTSFNTNGFSIGTTSGTNVLNASGVTNVAWQWKAGGTAVTNTAGSITSSVSANTTSGFSVVTFTSPSSFTNATIGHGLGVTPAMIITKSRTSVGGWVVWHISLGVNGYLSLDSTSASGTNSQAYNGTSSTTFTMGSNSWWQAASQNWVSYCFAAIPGYSAFGSYTGNGSSDGPFVFLGFRPRWIMFKRTDGADNWYVEDTSRDTYNPATAYLDPNQSQQEYSGITIDFVSNGFKIRFTGTGINGSGGSYIYAAFAENPFTNALAR